MSEIPSESEEAPEHQKPHPDYSASHLATAICLGFLIATIFGRLHPYEAIYSGLAFGAAVLLI